MDNKIINGRTSGTFVFVSLENKCFDLFPLFTGKAILVIHLPLLHLFSSMLRGMSFPSHKIVSINCLAFHRTAFRYFNFAWYNEIFSPTNRAYKFYLFFFSNSRTFLRAILLKRFAFQSRKFFAASSTGENNTLAIPFALLRTIFPIIRLVMKYARNKLKRLSTFLTDTILPMLRFSPFTKTGQRTKYSSFPVCNKLTTTILAKFGYLHGAPIYHSHYTTNGGI